MSPLSIPQPLTSFAKGVVVTLSFLAHAPAEVQRLRDLGIREGNVVQILKNAEALVCMVESSRIVLRREVAMQVFGVVQPA